MVESHLHPCPQGDGGEHVPDRDAKAIARNGGPTVVDVACKLCGRKGRIDTLSHSVNPAIWVLTDDELSANLDHIRVTLTPGQKERCIRSCRAYEAGSINRQQLEQAIADALRPS